MIGTADYGGEMDMPQEIDDATAEAVLAGRCCAPDLEPLVRVVTTYREMGRRPVRPTGELAARMATGAFVRRRRSTLFGRVVAIVAKLGGASLAVKASAGAVIALASTGTAGAAGVLPEVVQDPFDSVVEGVSGNETPDPTPGPTPAPADDSAEFGQDVREDARDGGVDGSEVSEPAGEQGEDRRPDQLPSQASIDAPGPPRDPGKPDDVPGPPTSRGGPPNQ